MSKVLVVLLTLGVIVVVVGLVWRGLGLESDFAIHRRRGGRIEIRGRVPAAKLGALRTFFSHDLDTAGPFTVRGSFDGPGRRARLRFSGRISPEQRQRVRNFLLEHLH
jgi:hypothetical protein